MSHLMNIEWRKCWILTAVVLNGVLPKMKEILTGPRNRWANDHSFMLNNSRNCYVTLIPFAGQFIISLYLSMMIRLMIIGVLLRGSPIFSGASSPPEAGGSIRGHEMIASLFQGLVLTCVSLIEFFFNGKNLTTSDSKHVFHAHRILRQN